MQALLPRDFSVGHGGRGQSAVDGGVAGGFDALEFKGALGCSEVAEAHVTIDISIIRILIHMQLPCIQIRNLNLIVHQWLLFCGLYLFYVERKALLGAELEGAVVFGFAFGVFFKARILFAQIC